MVECDESDSRVGAVLIQEQLPIAYFSQALHGKNVTLSTYEKKMIALVSSKNKWQPYLVGNQFIVWKDQRSLKHLWQPNHLHSCTEEVVGKIAWL